MLVWQAWLGTTTLFWPPSPLLGVTSVLITIPFVFSSCYFCFQAQAGWLQHDFGHLSVFKKSKWDHFFHYLTIGAIKVTTVVVPAPVFLWLPSACGFFSSFFFCCPFFFLSTLPKQIYTGLAEFLEGPLLACACMYAYMSVERCILKGQSL